MRSLSSQGERCLEQSQLSIFAVSADDVSNSLWASARLHIKFQHDHGFGTYNGFEFVKSLAKHIRPTASNMTPLQLSSCLWGLAHFKGAAEPDAVVALVEQIQGNVDEMSLQQLSDCLWASLQLQDVTPDVMKILPALGSEVKNKGGEQ